MASSSKSAIAEAGETYITAEEMKRIEDRAEQLGVSRLLMMENAGKSVADYLRGKIGPEKKNVVVVAGTGDNGGDGFVAARHLARHAWVKVFLVGRREDVRSPRAGLNLGILEKMKTVELHELSSGFLDRLGGALANADFVIDAIFGTGIKGKLREPHASVIRRLNESTAFKLAVDVPSGLDPSTGEVHDLAIKADATVTFHRPKVGLSLRGDLVGELVVADIGIPPEADVPSSHASQTAP